MPCIVLPLMAIVKFLEWFFAKFFGKKQTAAEPSDTTKKELEPAAKTSSGCPFAAMGISMPNPHIG